MQGPEEIKHDNYLFITYSASHCSTDNYALGLLAAKDTSNPLDPKSWTKSPNPVFQSNPSG